MSADKKPSKKTAAQMPEDETKRKFREALEAKQGRHGEDHVDADPHPPLHSHGPVNEKRVFRRKTG
ncbi:hypothetical protein JOE57_001709 [Microlunatus panaciterrae]|uniref:DUF5302 domain-containing protein n=1 Tax=Microlunatus panaciterrae TaxID=400768 RepID=A0ABS2RJA3_9ACTN|nr:DUF5302 domain-containing protein [Microlunatus panaciterrae]MBM7798788.1 hypothetical protein [Microlunatus panaciterrae]